MPRCGIGTVGIHAVGIHVVGISAVVSAMVRLRRQRGILDKAKENRQDLEDHWRCRYSRKFGWLVTRRAVKVVLRQRVP